MGFCLSEPVPGREGIRFTHADFCQAMGPGTGQEGLRGYEEGTGKRGRCAEKGVAIILGQLFCPVSSIHSLQDTVSTYRLNLSQKAFITLSSKKAL